MVLSGYDSSGSPFGGPAPLQAPPAIISGDVTPPGEGDPGGGGGGGGDGGDVGVFLTILNAISAAIKFIYTLGGLIKGGTTHIGWDDANAKAGPWAVATRAVFLSAYGAEVCGQIAANARTRFLEQMPIWWGLQPRGNSDIQKDLTDNPPDLSRLLVIFFIWVTCNVDAEQDPVENGRIFTGLFNAIFLAAVVSNGNDYKKITMPPGPVVGGGTVTVPPSNGGVQLAGLGSGLEPIILLGAVLGLALGFKKKK